MPNQSIAGILFSSLVTFCLLFIIYGKSKFRFTLIPVALYFFYELIVSGSRSGWIGLICCLLSIVLFFSKYKKKWIKYLVAASGILFFLFLTLFFKQGSSMGRVHIYHLSGLILHDNWITGIGLGEFKTLFNQLQADYFTSGDIDSTRALLADNTYYAFNDYLQWIIETGLLGILIMCLFASALVVKTYVIRVHFKSNPFLLSSLFMLLTILIGSLFSYPLQNSWIQLVTTSLLLVIAFHRINGGTPLIKTTDVFLKIIVSFLFILSVINAFDQVKRDRLEERAFNLSTCGYRSASLETYRFLIHSYPKRGTNWFFYARELFSCGRYSEALQSVKESINLLPCNKAYKLKGDIEIKLMQTKDAEVSYLRSIYMVPNRIGSRFTLMNYYFKQRNLNNALFWANSILNMPIKVQSSKANKMIQKTKAIKDYILDCINYN